MTVSALGDWIATFALIALVWSRTRSAGAVAGLLGLRVIPSIFSGAVAAVISDRFDRKKTMIYSDIIRGLLILLAAMQNSLAYLYTIIFFMELFSIIYLAARDAGVPHLVSTGDQLTMANTMILGSTYGVLPISSAIFALLVVGTSPFLHLLESIDFFSQHPYSVAFAADALSFFFSAYMVSRIGNPLIGPHQKLERGEGNRIGKAISFAWREPFMRAISGAIATGTLGGGSLFTVGVVYVHDVLGGNDTQFGFLMGLFGAGMLAGMIFLQFLGRIRAKGAIFKLCLLVSGGTLIWMSLITVMFMAYIAALAFGAAFSMLFMAGITLVQEEVSDENRGKAFAAFHSISRVFLVLGAGLAAVLASAIGKHEINLGLFSINIWGATIAMFAGGLLIAGASFIPIYSGRKAAPTTPGPV
jgi:dTMP kinase